MPARTAAWITPRRRAWAMVGIGVFLTALAVKTPWAPFPPGVIVAAGLAGSLSLIWLERRPVLVAVIGAATYVACGSPWPMWAGLVLVGMGLQWRPLLGAGVSVSTAWAALEFLQSGSLGVNDVSSAVLQAVAIGGAGVYLGTRRQLEESLRAAAERAESDRMLREEQARLEERESIAREMHDVLAHKVTLIALHAGALEVNRGSTEPAVGAAAGLIRSTAHEALEELRRVLGMLRDSRPEMDDEFADVQGLVEEWRSVGVRVDLEHRAVEASPAIRRTIFRVVQEGLTNANKHAAGADVFVAVACADGHEVTVQVTNGPPREPRFEIPGSGAGLAGLEERLRLLDGSLDAGPSEDGGWRLVARIPMAAAVRP